jgi:prepilin-type N-terminal cleavage/methylation domain-containing protein
VRLRQRISSERGFSLVEMLTVMIILGVIMSGLTTLFVQGSNAEVDMNARFQAQQGARVALDRMRRDLHCGSVATSTTSTAVTVTVPCATGSTVTWCVLTSSGRLKLFRQTGATACTTSSTPYADYLLATNAGGTQPTFFAYQAQSTANLATLYVCIPVNARPRQSANTYALQDAIVLRNSTRTGTATTTTQPACP